MKLLKICSAILGILMIVAGFYCILRPDITGLSIGYIIGISMIVDAIGLIHAWFQLKRAGQGDVFLLISGILSAVFGIALVADVAAQLFLDMFIAYMAAFWILAEAIVTIIRAFVMRRVHKDLETRSLGSRWWVGLIIGILLIVLAVLCLAHPGIVITYIGILIGLGVIFAGLFLITLATLPSVE